MARAPILRLAGPASLLLAALLGACGYLWLKHVPVVFEADSTVILTVHQQTSANPYTYFPKAVITTAQVVAAQVGQQTVRDQVVAAGGLRTYDVSVQNDGNQWVPIYTHPTITFTVQSTNYSAVIATEAIVVQKLQDSLTGIQRAAGVPDDYRINMEALGRGDATALHGRRSRAIAAIGILSLWSSLLIVRSFERRLKRRGHRLGERRRRQAAPASSVTVLVDREKDLVGAQAAPK